MASPIFELFSNYIPNPSYDVSDRGIQFGVDFRNQKGSFAFNHPFAAGNAITLSYGINSDNQVLLMLKGEFYKNNIYNHEVINLNFSRLNFTEQKIDICEKFGCANIPIRNVLKKKEISFY